ncbi:phosphate ABC transporter permease PstA [Nocardioides sp. MAHUQ-72]|uniref:phosphate ABC transporter permease PstA n=1 Tax=unclassified Nocardioides TaxID=2615069 RepID=UPI00361FA0FD
MSTTEATRDLAAPMRLSHPLLPKWAPTLVVVLAVAAAGLPAMLLGWSLVGWLALALVLFLVGLPAWSLAVENRRAAVDRLMTALVWSSFGVAVLPLVWLVWTVVAEGASVIDGEFLTYSMRNIVGEGGGIYHALIGTLLVTAAAAVISVPVGIFAAIYLVEYGKGTRLGRWITFLVDVMTGIPSIVAGLFALALFVLLFGPETRMGFGGSVALSLLMIPIVVRATEEMLRLVPADLREASYALGVPKWRTITKVVLPTAMGGIITGVTLAVARVIGETAPLLVIAGKTDSVNANLFNERMTTLPVYIYYSFTQPGVAPAGSTEAPGIARAWGAALVLIVIVMVLNLLARVVGKFFTPKKG